MYKMNKKIEDLNNLANLIPNFIEIETSTFCNRNCSWCPNSKYQRNKYRKYISKKLFTKIIEDLKKIKYDGQISLHNYNEPLLDLYLFDHIDLITKKLPESKIIIFTNGDFLNKDVYNKLKKHGVTSLIISLHDAVNSTEKGKILIFNILKKIAKRGKLIDVSDCFGKKLKIPSTRMEIIFYIPYKKMLTSKGGIIKKLEKNNRNSFCFLPFSSSAIDYEGNMKICCEIYPENKLHKSIGIIGNLKEQSFSELWFSDQYNNLRRSFILNKVKNEICLMCPKNNYNIHNKKINIWKEFLINLMTMLIMAHFFLLKIELSFGL